MYIHVYLNITESVLWVRVFLLREYELHNYRPPTTTINMWNSNDIMK